MLSREDLDSIRQVVTEIVTEIVDAKFAVFKEEMSQMMDEKLAISEQNMLMIMDEKIVESQNLVLAEVDRLRETMFKRFDKIDEHFKQIEDRLLRLENYYFTSKLDHETVNLLVQLVNKHDIRIENLERKFA